MRLKVSPIILTTALSRLYCIKSGPRIQEPTVHHPYLSFREWRISEARFPRRTLLGNRMNKEEGAFSSLSRKLCWSVDLLLLLLAKEHNPPLTRLLPTLSRHSLPTARQAGGQRSSPPQPKVVSSFQAG